MALGARQQVKIWNPGQLSRHYIAEVSLNVTLNHNQPTNQPLLTWPWVMIMTHPMVMVMVIDSNYVKYNQD